MKHLLEENEKAFDAECERGQQLTQQVQQLQEMKDVLQLQLEEGGAGGTAAEKQVNQSIYFLHS